MGERALSLAEAARSIQLPTVTPATAAQGRARLVIILCSLLYLFGLVMVTSAASGTSLLQDGDQWEFFRRQATFGALGFLVMFAALRFPLTVLQRLAWPMLLVSVGLLLLVFLPGLAHSANGATRWIRLGSFQLQPSEVVKLAVIIYVADHLSRARPPTSVFVGFIRSPGGVALGAAGLVFVQNDLGTALVIGATVMVMYAMAGTSIKLLFQTIGPGLALVALGIVSEGYRRRRFLAFLDPWGDAHGNGYQLVQAQIAIGSGGLFGAGLGHSVQKVHFLPEAHTDMIFSIVVEELGLVGVAVVLFGFAAIAMVGTRIALRATDRFHALLAIGITTALVLQAVINLGGVVGVLPLTGVPLPLISYGGSNLLISMAMLGLLANVATASHVTPGRRYEDDDGFDDVEDTDAPAAGRRRRRWNRRPSGTRAVGR